MSKFSGGCRPHASAWGQGRTPAPALTGHALHRRTQRNPPVQVSPWDGCRGPIYFWVSGLITALIPCPLLFLEQLTPAPGTSPVPEGFKDDVALLLLGWCRFVQDLLLGGTAKLKDWYHYIYCAPQQLHLKVVGLPLMQFVTCPACLTKWGNGGFQSILSSLCF